MNARPFLLALAVLAALPMHAAARSKPESAANHQIYLNLRNEALATKRESLDLPPSAPPGPWAVVMDIRSDGDYSYTTLATADGNVNIYTSSGAAMLGSAQNHPEVYNAALRMLQAATAAQPALQPVGATPLPEPSHVTFYLLTDKGTLGASVSNAELADSKQPLLPLYAAGQILVQKYYATQRR